MARETPYVVQEFNGKGGHLKPGSPIVCERRRSWR